MVVNHTSANHLHRLEFLEHDWFAALSADTAGHMVNLFAVCQRGTCRLWKFTLFRHYLNPFRLSSVCLSGLCELTLLHKPCMPALTCVVVYHRETVLSNKKNALLRLFIPLSQADGEAILCKRNVKGWGKTDYMTVKRGVRKSDSPMIHMLQKFTTNTALQECTTRRATAKTTSTRPNTLKLRGFICLSYNKTKLLIICNVCS